MPAKFELYKDKKGEFRLKSSNGENILSSEGYKAKYRAKNGKQMFNPKVRNHQIIGTSQMYSSTASCNDGIKSVKTNAPKAKVEDLT
jgi:uncharacterized protein YegP (UPF0339 family)